MASYPYLCLSIIFLVIILLALRVSTVVVVGRSRSVFAILRAFGSVGVDLFRLILYCSATVVRTCYGDDGQYLMHSINTEDYGWCQDFVVIITGVVISKIDWIFQFLQTI